MEKKREKTINFDENIKKLEELVNDEAIDKAIIDAQALLDKYPVKKDTLIVESEYLMFIFPISIR